ncbi:MAG: hypothetical protein EOO38_29345, partial [Cytophagaceae bacterium]
GQPVTIGAQAPAQVRILSLRECGIEGPGLRALNLDGWKGLRELDLSENNLEQTSNVTAYWSSLLHLQTLAMVHCNLDDESVAKICAADMPRLESLLLCRNRLTAVTLQALWGQSLPSLESLDLADCNFANFTGEQALTRHAMAAKWLASVPKLADLRLSRASLSTEKLHWLHLETIGNLRRLDLANNPLGPNALDAFEDQVLPHLTHLSLENSLAPIPGQLTLRPLVTEAVSMPNLESLRLTDTNLSEHNLFLDVALSAVTEHNNDAYVRGLVTTAACKIGTTAIFDCDKLTNISLCMVPDLTASRFALRAFPHLRHIVLDAFQEVAPLDVAFWASQAPRLRQIASGVAEEGFLLAPQYP